MIRLFMSTDVAGSTQYKVAASHQAGTAWLEVFRQFFANFPIVLMGQVGLEFIEEDSLPELSIWKFMGDEAIFVTEATSPAEVTRLVRAHFNAMAAYEAEYLLDFPLQLKGTAWLARFPSPNIQIEVPELSGQAGAEQTDFIGPDIDLGFRITKFARPSTVTISLDVLDTVLRSSNRELLDLYLVGREELKGVLFGRPYPTLWARSAGAPKSFVPWDVEDDPRIAAVMTGGPTPDQDLRNLVDSVRLYQRRMHGLKAEPLAFREEG